LQCPLYLRKRTSDLGQFVRRNSSGSLAILAVSNLLPEDAGGGTAFVAASYFQLSDGPKSRSSFCRVSRSDSQYCTNKSGPAKRKSCSTARRQKGLRPLSQACPSGGKRGKIDSSKIELGVSIASVMFLTAAPSGGNSSCTFHWCNPARRILLSQVVDASLNGRNPSRLFLAEQLGR
jgi:hypothetical protein